VGALINAAGNLQQCGLLMTLGLAALARNERPDTGPHREILTQLREAVEVLVQQKPAVPVAAICCQVLRFCARSGETHPFDFPVY